MWSVGRVWGCASERRDCHSAGSRALKIAARAGRSLDQCRVLMCAQSQLLALTLVIAAAQSATEAVARWARRTAAPWLEDTFDLGPGRTRGGVV